MRNKAFILNIASIKTIVIALVIMLAVSTCFLTNGVYATEEEGGEAEAGSEQAAAPQEPAPAVSTGSVIMGLRDELDDLRAELEEVRARLEAATKEYKALAAQITVLEALIEETEGEIDVLHAIIVEHENTLFELRARIVELDREVYDQNSALNKRLRIMYETGEQSILAVLLGSENFVDFLSNLEMVRRIHESDKAFLEQLEEMLDEVEQKKIIAEDIEEELKRQRNELQDQRDQLEADKAELAVAKQRAKEIRDKAAADEERLEQESKRIEQELVNLTSQWGDYAGGAMAWPVIGPITSPFGMRVHPITGRWTPHNGIDVGASMGTPIHAAADGLVYFAGWNSGGYGNLVMIDNGSGIFTLYAHCSAFAVSKGNIVHRGDIIAYVGSTGNSTGPHLHFEVRQNGTPQNPLGWLG